MESGSRILRRIVGAIMTAIVLESAGLHSDSARAAEPLQAHTIRDDYRTEVPVAGIVAHGVMWGGKTAGIDATTLNVLLPALGARNLCYTIASRDGHYLGEFGLEVPRRVDRDSGIFRIKMDTTHAREWQGLAAGELVVDARLQDSDCKVPNASAEIVAASWNDASWPKSLTVFANLRDADGRVVVPSTVAGASPRRISCQKGARGGPGMPRVAFDAECSFDLQPTDRLEEAVLERTDGEEILSGAPLKIVLTRARR